MHKKLIKKLIENGKTEDMEYLEELLDDLICDLKDTNRMWYDNIELDMYKRVYGEHIDEELAKKWVSCMENNDGTNGQHWSPEQTSQFAGNHNKWDWYVVLNMVYSDYYNQKFDVNDYVELANNWLNDRDIEDCKLLKYYFYIVK